jgi:hypothetical protein
LDSLQPAWRKDFRGLAINGLNINEMLHAVKCPLVACFTGKGLESLPALRFTGI